MKKFLCIFLQFRTLRSMMNIVVIFYRKVIDYDGNGGENG